MFFPQFTAANTKSITRNRSDKPISGCPLAPLDQIHKKAQDRDGGEEIASNSVLKIRMKNAVLRSQAALSAQPAPQRPDRQASEADARLLSGMHREQRLLKL
jgi:hypothetical protein